MPHHEGQPADPNALNVMLMQGSAEIHREAERVPFMVAFFKAELPKDAYAAYLGRLWYVYEALEDASSSFPADDPMSRFTTPELFRLTRLGRDVAAYAGPDWQQTITPSPATKAYADRIREVAQPASQHRLVAHHWLRYLGYVLGQDILNKLVTKAYGEDAPREFYAFPDIEDPKIALRQYHGKLNTLPLTDEQKQDVVDEGNRAFALQKALTEELAADFGIGDVTEDETDAIVEKLKDEHP
jgi:heme oxygenase (biliverdin-producing, ferredoxin)